MRSPFVSQSAVSKVYTTHRCEDWIMIRPCTMRGTTQAFGSSKANLACRSTAARLRVRQGCSARSKTLQTRATPSDVYVFSLEGVICEESGQVYGNAQQLQAFEAPYYITSSFEADKMSAMLDSAGVKLPADSPQLFGGLDADNTVATLRKISDRPVVKDTGARLNFLSASGKALQLAHSDKDLSSVRLYLAGWSQEGQQSTGKIEGISELEEKQFSELLSWGLIMGVDDGCGDDN